MMKKSSAHSGKEDREGSLNKAGTVTALMELTE